MNANVENAVLIKNENVKNSFKVSVKNGSNLISFKLQNVVGSDISTTDIQMLSTQIISELSNLNDTNNRLKELGYKGNFFSFTTGRKCILAVEVLTENENFTLVKNLQFSFGKIAKLQSDFRELALHAILGGTINTNNNGLLIDKIK